MGRTVTANRVVLTVALGLLAGPASVSAHVAHNAPAAVGLMPDEVQAPVPAGRPAQSPPPGRVTAGAVAAGLAASLGLLLRQISVRNGSNRSKSASPPR